MARFWSKLLTSNKRGALIAMAAKIVGTAVGFLLNFALARILGPSGIGVYFLALTVVSIGGTLARLGLDMAGLRFAAIAYKNSELNILASLYRQCLALILVSAGLLSLISFSVAPYLPLGGDSRSEFLETLYIVTLAIFPIAFIRVQGHFYKAVEAPGKGIFVQTALLQIIILVYVFFYQLYEKDITVSTVAHMYVHASFITVVLSALHWLFKYPESLKLSALFSTKKLLKTSMPLLWVASMGLIFQWTDTLVLGFWTESDDVGIYGIASRIAALTSFVLLAVNSVTSPRFAFMYSKGNIFGMERLAQKSIIWMLAAITPAVIIILLFPEPVLSLFGDDFTSGSWLLRILTLGQFINVAVGTVGSIMIMSGHGIVVRNNTIIGITVNLVGNLLLIPLFGAVGAAISTAGSIALQNILLYYKVRTILGIQMINIKAPKAKKHD